MEAGTILWKVELLFGNLELRTWNLKLLFGKGYPLLRGVVSLGGGAIAGRGRCIDLGARVVVKPAQQ